MITSWLYYNKKNLTNDDLLNIWSEAHHEKVEFLDLSGNAFSGTVQFPHPLPDLKVLEMSGNKEEIEILDIPPFIFPNLQHLYLQNSQIKNLRIGSDFEKLEYLYLYGNPIENIPKEIFDKEKENVAEAVRDYFQSIAKVEDRRELNEAKLIIVGVGEVGKSELAEALSDPNYVFVEGRKSTVGIRIKTWVINCEKEDQQIEFKTNIWDFAGQEINYGTHQFFLTKNSVYVFVWEPRKGEDQSKFDYWLNIVSLLSENAPVFVVQNKIDIYTSEINQGDWKKKFSNIAGFYKTSCQNGIGIAELRQQVQTQLLSLPHTAELWNKDRYTIRETLEQNPENYIPHRQYLRLCTEKNLTPEQSGFLGRQLHDIGVILHYPDDIDLKDTVVLKPEWATQAAYCLLDNKKINKGRFHTSELDKIWEDESYDGKHSFLLGLMRKFELVFQFQESDYYIVPELLPVEMPENLPDIKTAGRYLQFEYHYDFMPKGIISRFICRMHEQIEDDLFWRFGVVLKYQDSQALVISNEVEKEIQIIVSGKEADTLLAIVRRDFDSIHKKLRNPELTEMIPCICEFCQTQPKPHLFNFEELQEYKNEGILHIRCGKKVKNQVLVSALLAGILDTKDENIFGGIPSLKQIEQAIKDNHLKQAIDGLIMITQDSHSDYYNELLIHSRIFTQIEKERFGVLSNDDYNAAATRIAKALLSILNELKPK
ncbi:MAG: COR domain-containing protein [Bacteroidia bacterium]